MSADGDGKGRATGELKEIQRPLLEVDKKSDGSPVNSDDVHIPDSKVQPVVDDAQSGFTQGAYMRPQNFKSQTQVDLDHFLNVFMESAGVKVNERSQEDKRAVEESE